VVIDDREAELTRLEVRASGRQLEQRLQLG
jgi:hypothetical protein